MLLTSLPQAAAPPLACVGSASGPARPDGSCGKVVSAHGAGRRLGSLRMGEVRSASRVPTALWRRRSRYLPCRGAGRERADGGWSAGAVTTCQALELLGRLAATDSAPLPAFVRPGHARPPDDCPRVNGTPAVGDGWRVPGRQARLLTERCSLRAGHDPCRLRAVQRRIMSTVLTPVTDTLLARRALADAAAPPPGQACGGRSAALPETGFVRQRQVLVLVPFSKSTLWRRVQAGSFPQPVKLSDRITAWRAEDLRRWIQSQGPAS